MQDLVLRPRDNLLGVLPKMDIEIRATRQSLGLDLPVAVINLPHRADRWHAVSSRMATAGIDKLLKVPAIVGAQLPDATIGQFLGLSRAYKDAAPLSHLSLTKPAIGCFLSHLSVWHRIIESGLPRVLVLEDDARPTAAYDPRRFRSFVESLPQNAGLVFPGCLIMAGLAETPSASSPLARLFYFNGTFSYLITPDACRFLLDRILPLRAHIDHQLSSIFLADRNHFAAFYATAPFFEPDWSLVSDCYVPLADDVAADDELGRLLRMQRKLLADEGHVLLPPS